MANSEMIEHISTARMERFCARVLPEAELKAAARHLTDCQHCHRQFIGVLRRQRESSSFSFTLAPEFWLRHEHIDYERLVEFTDNRLSKADREPIDLHLNLCAPCREDVQSFVEFRERIAPEMDISLAPSERQPGSDGSSSPWVRWWGGLAWKPIYAAAVIVIGIAIVIVAALLVKRSGENLQVQQTPTPQVSPGSTPDNREANVPPLPATPNESPGEKPNSAEVIVALNDRGGPITVDKSGNVTGLDDVPTSTREEIAKVLLSERLERPAILKELGGQEGTVRGPNNAQPFKLTFPSRTVIVSDRPTLKWERVSGATSYRVYINDPTGREVARSDELTSGRTEWILPRPLKRGEIYVWTVVAEVDGKEIVSPGPSAPEMKFQVLSTTGAQQLNRLKKTRSQLALGVFYAREGMIAEAQREFRMLVRDNPRSQHAYALLREIQSWQRR
jgi:hypothetical protein